MTNKLEKIFEDNYIIVFNKPAGLIVNRSKTTKDITLQDLLERDYPFTGDNEEFLSRSGIVHRLDKDTSGVLVVAKTQEAFVDIQKQFKNREVYKEYIALAHGKMKHDILEINAPIKRNPNSPFKFAVVRGGRESQSTIVKIKDATLNGSTYTLVKVMPKTGRTHQIRVHLASLGHHVVHDNIYCTKTLLKQDIVAFDRMMLHATLLRFKHPISGKLVEYTSEKPGDFNI